MKPRIVNKIVSDFLFDLAGLWRSHSDKYKTERLVVR